MLFFLLLLVATAPALAAFESEEDQTIENVNKNATQHNIDLIAIAKHLEEIANSGSVDESLKQVVVNSNKIAKIENVHLAGRNNSELIIQKLEANAKITDYRLQEITNVLKLILVALGKNGTFRDTETTSPDPTKEPTGTTVLPMSTPTVQSEDATTIPEGITTAPSKATTTVSPEKVTTALPTTTKSPIQGRDCAEIHNQGERANGIYAITHPSKQLRFEVYCDMKTDGGGWTVFQRRGNFKNQPDFFNRTWVEYKSGFGDKDKEFWLGNDHLSALTEIEKYSLRVDLWDMEDNHAFAKYSTFRVENEQQKYRLNIAGYSGNAGDSMITTRSFLNLNGMAFTTTDKDNDRLALGNCAVVHGSFGGWWHNDCYYANLNGLNHRSSDWSGIVWYHWKNSQRSLAATEMKIRPVDFKIINRQL